MRQCRGWVEDQDRKYTVNYIIVILLAEVKLKKLLILDAYDKYFILCDHELQRIFDIHEPFLKLEQLRMKVVEQMIQTECFYFNYGRDYNIPLWCTTYLDSVLRRIFDNLYECRESIVIDYCGLLT